MKRYHKLISTTIVMMAAVLFSSVASAAVYAQSDESQTGATEEVAVELQNSSGQVENDSDENTPTAQQEVAVATPTDQMTPQQKWQRANESYQKGDYNYAILLYEELLMGDTHSAQIYYNLGNGYYKQNILGKAIVNYHRALLLDPSNEDIRHNLAVAQARTIDRIEPLPQFILKRWYNSIGNMMSSNGWTILMLVTLAAALGGAAVWLTSPKLGARKAGFYTALPAIMISVLSFLYARSGYIRQTSDGKAVVINTAAPVKSSPADTGKDLFLLREGTTVMVQDRVDQWCQIVLEDGNKGWIQKSALESVVKATE